MRFETGTLGTATARTTSRASLMRLRFRLDRLVGQRCSHQYCDRRSTTRVGDAEMPLCDVHACEYRVDRRVRSQRDRQAAMRGRR